MILFTILFVHLDQENLHPTTVLVAFALIALLGVCLYRRRIDRKLCKNPLFSDHISCQLIDSPDISSARELEKVSYLSTFRSVGLAGGFYADENDQHRHHLRHEYLDDAHPLDILRLWI